MSYDTILEAGNDSPAALLGYSAPDGGRGLGYTTELLAAPATSLGYSAPGGGGGGYTTELSTAPATSLGYSAPDGGGLGYSEPDGAYSSDLVAGGGASGGGPLRTKELPSVFDGEQKDASVFRGPAANWSSKSDTPGTQFDKVTTRYLGDDEQAKATVQVKDGLLHDGNGAIHTKENSGTGTQHRLGEGKNIYAMTPDGDLRSTAAWESHREIAEDPGRPDLKTLSMVNHSSLAAVADPATGGRKAGAAAAAGELQVNQGKLEMLTDQSGHYRPDNVMTYQALDHLEGAGVDMHDVAVKTTPKGSQGYVADSANPDERYMYASARELMAHEGAEDAEAQMRAQRKAMKGAIGNAAAEREQRLDGHVPEDPRAARDQAFLQSLAPTPAEEIFAGQY